MSTDAELKPCPFCGHVGLDFTEGSTFRWLAYSCSGCGIGSETRMQTLGNGTKDEWRAAAERDAVAAWNTRAAEAAGPAWLIECKNGFTGWWDGRERVDCRFFDKDPNKAHRFQTKAEAEAVIAQRGNSCMVATEHSWLAAPPQAGAEI